MNPKINRMMMDRLPADWPELADARTQWERLLQVRADASKRSDAAWAARERAQHDETRARGLAMRMGETPTTDSTVAELTATIASAERDHVAAADAMLELADETHDLIAAKAPEWNATTKAAADTARKRYAKAVENLATAAADLQAAEGRAQWIAHFDSQPVFRPTRRVLDIAGENGEHFSVTAIVAALRADLEPREVTERPDAQPLAGRPTIFANIGR